MCVSLLVCSGSVCMCVCVCVCVCVHVLDFVVQVLPGDNPEFEVF